LNRGNCPGVSNPGYRNVVQEASKFGACNRNAEAVQKKQQLVAEILALPIQERIRLVGAIWDSISVIPEVLPLTQWQREELDRRLAEFEADAETGSTLEDVFARIRRVP